MRFALNNKQSVLVDDNSDPRVFLRHRAENGSYHVLVLNRRQTKNLFDVFDNYDLRKERMIYPIGEPVWLQCEDGSITLRDYRSGKFFYFMMDSLKTYIRKVHPRIRSILRHADRRHNCVQLHATSEAEHEYIPKKVLSKVQKANSQVLPSEAANATHDNEQWKKRSTISRRRHSNSRPRFRPRGSRHARSVSSSLTSSEEDGEVFSTGDDDDQKSGCAISID